MSYKIIFNKTGNKAIITSGENSEKLVNAGYELCNNLSGNSGYDYDEFKPRFFMGKTFFPRGDFSVRFSKTKRAVIAKTNINSDSGLTQTLKKAAESINKTQEGAK